MESELGKNGHLTFLGHKLYPDMGIYGPLVFYLYLIFKPPTTKLCGEGGTGSKVGSRKKGDD